MHLVSGFFANRKVAVGFENVLRDEQLFDAVVVQIQVGFDDVNGFHFLSCGADLP